MTNRQRGLFMAWIIPMIFFFVIPFSTNDLAGWIAHGRYFLDHHEILRNDIFSVFPSEPLIYPSWGVSIIYAWIYRWGGLETVCLMHFLVLLAILKIVYSHSISSLENPTENIARWSIYVFWLVGVALFEVRPNMVALIPLIITYALISKVKSLSDLGPKLILQLSLINILWVNIHGSFILLEAMLAWKVSFLAIDSLVNSGAYREHEAHSRTFLWIRCALSIVVVSSASLVNPFNYRVYPYIFETIQKSKERGISEWAPTTPWTTFPIGFLYFLLLATIVFLVYKRRKRNDFWRFLSSPFFPILFNGLSAIRNAPLPFIILLPALKEADFIRKQGKISANSDFPKLSNIFKVAPFVLLLILSFPNFKAKTLFFLPADEKAVFEDSELFEITDKIRASGRICPIFNDWKVGSFLMLNLPNKVFLDFRNIIYSDQEFEAYAKVLRAEAHWEDLLNQYQACFAIVDRKSSLELLAALKNSKNWHMISQGDRYVAFAKT